ncbi:MAG: Na+/H+ antiporter subunit E [Oscillospiraceae bacterium]|nr:Na+/H+ antiporter subunit E [Oscillospiraceae bacterium]
MNRSSIYAFVGLVLIWVILAEELSIFTVAIGAVIALACLAFGRKFIPLKRVQGVRFYKLLTYPFYLIGEIYAQGFIVIRLILTGARADITKVQTELQSDFLRAILVNSVTLTPGSIPLDLSNGTLTVLNLAPKDGGDSKESVDALKNRMERRLIKAEQRGRR